MIELTCKILHIGKTTYYKYKKSNEPILELLKHFNKDGLKELLETGKITELEDFKQFQKTKNTKEYQDFLEFKAFQDFKNNL